MTEPVYDQQDADNYHLATENRNLKKRIEELEQQIAALRAENEQAQQREEAWEANCNTAWQTVDDMTARAEAAEAQLAALQAENEELKLKINLLEDELREG